MSQYGIDDRRLKPSDLRVVGADHPEWISGSERTPVKGERVRCTAGLAEVVQVLGRTGNGSRLLALRLIDGPHPPFFVAASNVLLAPPGLAIDLIG